MKPECFVSLVFFGLFLHQTSADQGLELGFPESWLGDSYRNVSCRVSEIPDWLDGYFLALVNAAYGRSTDSAGAKLTHMFDGLAALASVQFKDGMVRFSGKYLPTKAYKIWDFYGRDMRRSQVAWSTLRSPHMAAIKEKWDQIAADYFPHNPNVDLWKIGSRIVAAAETPEIGLQFDVASLSEFRRVDIRDTNELFAGRSSIKPLTATAHCKTEPDGTVYGTMSGLEPSTNRMYQFVFKITSKGVRTLEGAFEYGRYESAKCGSDLRYMGDKRVLAGVVKSIASTEQYLIIPISSAIINPCKYKAKKRKYKPRNNLEKQWEAANSNRSEGEDAQDFLNAVEFGTDVPVRFLIFHKQKRQFVINRPMDSYPPRFVSHQVNAYEIDENRIILDMITYDNYESYDRSLYVDSILRDSNSNQLRPRPVRFTLDIQRGYIERTNLASDSNNVQAPMEFPAINPKYNGRRYRFAYVVQPPFAVGSQLGKIDVDDHSGLRNSYFSHGPSTVFGEPTFVPRPNSNGEDDGVLLSLGLETLSKRSVLYVIDAKTMRELGRAEMPVVVPFGFHSHYFDRQELIEAPNSIDTAQPLETIDSIFNKIYPNLAPLLTPNAAEIEKSIDQKQTTIPVVQHNQAESISKTVESSKVDLAIDPKMPILVTADPNPRPISISEPSPKSDPDSKNSGTTLFSGLLSSTSTAKIDSEVTTTQANVLIPPTHIGVPRGYYLSNGTFLELYPDGTLKSYPSAPTYAQPFQTPTPSTKPSISVQKPPYLSVDPSFINFVKSQIPPPPAITTPITASITSPSINFGQKSGDQSIIGQSDTKTPSSVTPYPRFIFPGHYATKPVTTPMSTVSKSRIWNGANNSYIVVDVIVDPNKRTRRPPPLDPIADDPEQNREPILSSSTTESPKSMAAIDQTNQEIEFAKSANDALGRFLERSKSIFCNLLGKAVSAFGSNFCKGDAKEERKSKNVKDKARR